MVADVLMISVIGLSLLVVAHLTANSIANKGPRCWKCCFRTPKDDYLYLNGLPMHRHCAAAIYRRHWMPGRFEVEEPE